MKATEGAYQKADEGVDISMNKSGIGCTVLITSTRVGSSPVGIKRLAFHFRGEVDKKLFEPFLDVAHRNGWDFR